MSGNDIITQKQLEEFVAWLKEELAKEQANEEAWVKDPDFWKKGLS